MKKFILIPLILSLSLAFALEPYADSFNKKIKVEDLLTQAHNIYLNPALVTNAGLTSKTEDNLKLAQDYLVEALSLAPARLDIIMSIANLAIERKNLQEALSYYDKALALNPSYIKALIYKSVWLNYLNSNKNPPLYKLRIVSRAKSSDVDSIIRLTQASYKVKITDSPKVFTEPSAIIILGYALEEDGTMRDVLIDRLNKALEAIKLNPKSIIIVTGGVAKNEKAEAISMKEWLVNKGVDETKIFLEPYARSTVENALYSTYILAEHNIKQALIVSSASHVRRAKALFDINAMNQGLRIDFSTLAVLDKPIEAFNTVDDSERFAITRDALKAYGLLTFDSYPFLER